MQDYIYSAMAFVAVAIHLIINFDLLAGRGPVTAHGARYRDFLRGILAYYVTDAAWGIFAGLGWTSAMFVDTSLYFICGVILSSSVLESADGRRGYSPGLDMRF